MNKIAWLFGFLLIISCDKIDQEKLDDNRDLLIKHCWGLPQVIEGNITSVNTFMNSPTLFNDNGIVKIGRDYEDYWNLINENTIRFQNAEINWHILSISDSSLHVNMNKMNTSEFIVECIYEAL